MKNKQLIMELITDLKEKIVENKPVHILQELKKLQELVSEND